MANAIAEAFETFKGELRMGYLKKSFRTR